MESDVPNSARQQMVAQVAAVREAQRKALDETFAAILERMQLTADSLVRQALWRVAKTISELHHFNEATSVIGQLVPVPPNYQAPQPPHQMGPNATSPDCCATCGHRIGPDPEMPSWLSGDRAILLAQFGSVIRKELKKGLGPELRRELDRKPTRSPQVRRLEPTVTKRLARTGRKPLDPWFMSEHKRRLAQGTAKQSFKHEARDLIALYETLRGRNARIPSGETVAKHLSRSSKLRAS